MGKNRVGYILVVHSCTIHLPLTYNLPLSVCVFVCTRFVGWLPYLMRPPCHTWKIKTREWEKIGKWDSRRLRRLLYRWSQRRRRRRPTLPPLLEPSPRIGSEDLRISTRIRFVPLVELYKHSLIHWNTHAHIDEFNDYTVNMVGLTWNHTCTRLVCSSSSTIVHWPIAVDRDPTYPCIHTPHTHKH